MSMQSPKMHEFEEGDFVSFPYEMGGGTGLITDVEYDPVEDDNFYEISRSDSNYPVYLSEEDMTLIKGIG